MTVALIRTLIVASGAYVFGQIAVVPFDRLLDVLR